MNGMSLNVNTATKTKSSMGVRGRLFVGFAIIGITLVIATLFALYKVTNAEYFSIHVIEVELPTYEAINDLNIQLYETRASLREWVISQDNQVKIHSDQAWKLLDEAQSTLNNLSAKWTDPRLTQNWQKIRDLINEYKTSQEKVLNSPAASAKDMLKAETMPLFNQILNLLDGAIDSRGKREGGMFDLQHKKLNQGAHLIINEMDTIRLTEYTLLFLVIFLSITVALYTVRGMSKGLAAITKQINEASLHMVTAITEVKHSVEVQSSGASEQASSVNEITASLEEIEKSSNQTIEKAKTLGEVAERTREKGQLGLEAVEQSIIGMKAVRDKVQAIAQTILELSNQTQQVGEITAVVNTLAQQSKMLALNASIEAAKAGEAGKGFAVVASEVKNLAEQSEESTAQVQKILEDIRRATEKAVMATEEGTKGVDHGTGLVEQTGEIVRSLSDVIYETTIASQQIEAAIRQEGLGIEQITAGMNEINQVTASFVESVTQTTEAIGNLGVMVKELKQYIDAYQI